MIVEDEVLLRNGLKTIIYRNSNDFQIVAEADNGVKALELIKITEPHIVISDIRMPEMDGLELARIIEENYPSIIKVIVSGYCRCSASLTAICLFFLTASFAH